MWIVISSLLALTVYVTAFLCAVHSTRSARTPQGSVGWVIFLMAMPVLAIPFYLFLGHHRFRGYRIARKESQRVVEGIKAFARQHAPDPSDDQMNLTPFEKIANMPAIAGNGFDLLIDGAKTFEAIFAAMDAAEKYLLIQFYIVHDDELGRALQERMITAAQRGVSVRFMTDAVGSHKLPADYSEKLRDAGVEVVDRNSQRGPKYRFQLNYRNHRKTVIADGTVGFIGGHNVGDEYMGRNPGFGAWRDTHARIRGPIVLQLQLIFVEDWHWATNQLLLDDLNWTATKAPENLTGLIVASGPGDDTETGSMMFFSAIAAARERIWIASPYFVPDMDVMAALRNAALRGVDVRILVPDSIDHYVTWLAGFAYFDEIRHCGARVFRYTQGFMHQKVMVVDDKMAAVGTTNLDNRSFRLNFEAMALYFDPRVAKAVDTMLRTDFDNSFELTRTIHQQPVYVRYGAPMARLFAPLL